METETPLMQQERESEQTRLGGQRVIYCAYIVKNGRRIYPRRAKAFRICLG